MIKISGGYIKKQLFASLFWFCSLLIIPFIHSTRIIDEDNLPKMIFLSALMTILSIRSLLYSSFRSFDKSLVILVLIITAYFTYSFTIADNYSSGIAALITLLLPFYLLLLMRANRLFISELIYLLIPIASIILCVIALIQFAILSIDLQPVHLIRATMSNKNFLSEALVIYLIICASGALNSKGITAKLNIAAISIILLTILLLQTLSAYACLAFFVFMVIPLFVLLFSEKSVRRKIILRFIVPGYIITGIVAILFMRTAMFYPVKAKVKYAFDVAAGNPLPSTNNGRQNSIYERLYLWKNSMKLFSESPVTGIGLSDWQIYWPKYGMQGASYLDAAIMRYEHPHNEYVLLLTETGVAGLICFGSFFIFILFTGFRLLTSNIERHTKRTVFLMLSGIFAMAFLSFFGYPFHRPYTAFLCMMLCLIILESADEKSRLSKFSTKLPGILLLIFSVLSTTIFANRLSGEYYMAKALIMQSKGNFGGMLRMLRKSENKYYTLDNSSTPLDWYKGFAMFYQGNDSALYYYQKAEQQNPYHVQTLSDIGALLENRGKHEEAIIYFNRVISFVPEYYQAHYNLAVAYFNLGKPADALREINARTNIGYEYQNTLDVILARNAEVAADSCGNSTKANTLITDKRLLRKINKLAIENGLGFRQLCCDTIQSRMLKSRSF